MKKLYKWSMMMFFGIFISLCTFFSFAPLRVSAENRNAEAEKLGITVAVPTGKSASGLLDGSYSTKMSFNPGDTITIKSDAMIHGLYIEWASIPSEWQLNYSGGSNNHGSNGFLHEYIDILEGATELNITLLSGGSICNIYAYSKGNLPDSVQVWQPPCDEADILVMSTHADDEILFLGSVLVEYAGERALEVQVVYFSNYFNGTVIREHEKLDGLWVSGVKNYPVNGDFDDIYADKLASAEKTFGYEKTLQFVVEQIRRFKPLVSVAQDTNGEYGHGTHMLTSKAMQEAVTVSMDKDVFPESAALYGTHDVPKTYIHLYGENKLYMDCRKPLSAFAGKTALEVTADAYKKHVSQQWCWFYVSDTYEYSCADFGLFRTTVGQNTSNDMLENVETYGDKAKRLKAEEEERVRIAKEEEERKKAEMQSLADAKESNANQTVVNNPPLRLVIFWIIGGIAVAAVLITAIIIIKIRKNNHKKT